MIIHCDLCSRSIRKKPLRNSENMRQAYYTGGRSTVAGVRKGDRQENSRCGLTLSVPLSQQVAVKMSWSKGLVTSVGGDFTMLGAMLQYRWYDD